MPFPLSLSLSVLTSVSRNDLMEQSVTSPVIGDVKRALPIAACHTKQLVEPRMSTVLMRSAIPGQSLPGLHN
jgi:hypothetical protein